MKVAQNAVESGSRRLLSRWRAKRESWELEVAQNAAEGSSEGYLLKNTLTFIHNFTD